jgi:tetratricopeptide (TPR) repeat protein
MRLGIAGGSTKIFGKKTNLSRDEAEAIQLVEAGQFQRAIQCFRSLVERNSDPGKKVDYLVCQANCWIQMGAVGEARHCLATAEEIAETGSVARLQIDVVVATMLVDEGKSEDALQELSRLLTKYKKQIHIDEFRELYENIQVQRAFILMHLSRNDEARPILEEAQSFELLEEGARSSVHCHLGRCYVESAEYQSAKQQFLDAQRIGVPEDWEAPFRYHFGYALYELGEFGAAKREFILGLQSRAEGPPLALVYKMLAKVSRKLGEHNEAHLYEEEWKLSRHRVS